MPGKLLIVDSIATNRIVLKVRLANAFYEVFQADTAEEAHDAIKTDAIDLVLINGHLDDCDAVTFCKELRSNPKTEHIPVLMICNQEDREARLQALKAGVNDVLVRPLDDVFLLARLRSLLRTRETAEESRLREKTNQALGFTEAPSGFLPQSNVHIVTAEMATSVRWAAVLKPMMPYKATPTVHSETLKTIASGGVPDVFVIAIDRAHPDAALRLLAEIRARASTRHAGILAVVNDESRRILVDAMDLGAHDVMVNGFDPDEMSLRVSTLVAQKRMSDKLRNHVSIGLEAAVTDPLTGLFNRRYALPQIKRLCDTAEQKGQRFAILMGDLDHFKQVNDQFGHAAGDVVLTEAARRLRENLRPMDLVARMGGEEFLIALAETTPEQAQQMATRLCELIRKTPFQISGQKKPVNVTMSIGVAMGGTGYTTKPVDQLIERADTALYDAKLRGRDQVRFSNAA